MSREHNTDSKRDSGKSAQKQAHQLPAGTDAVRELKVLPTSTPTPPSSPEQSPRSSGFRNTLTAHDADHEQPLTAADYPHSKNKDIDSREKESKQTSPMTFKGRYDKNKGDSSSSQSSSDISSSSESDTDHEHDTEQKDLTEQKTDQQLEHYLESSLTDSHISAKTDADEKSHRRKRHEEPASILTIDREEHEDYSIDPDDDLTDSDHDSKENELPMNLLDGLDTFQSGSEKLISLDEEDQDQKDKKDQKHSASIPSSHAFVEEKLTINLNEQDLSRLEGIPESLALVEKLMTTHHDIWFLYYCLKNYSDGFKEIYSCPPGVTRKEKRKEYGSYLLAKSFLNQPQNKDRKYLLQCIHATSSQLPSALDNIQTYINLIEQLKLLNESEFSPNLRRRIKNAKEFCDKLFYSDQTIKPENIQKYIEKQQKNLKNLTHHFAQISKMASDEEAFHDSLRPQESKYTYSQEFLLEDDAFIDEITGSDKIEGSHNIDRKLAATIQDRTKVLHFDKIEGLVNKAYTLAETNADKLKIDIKALTADEKSKPSNPIFLAKIEEFTEWEKKVTKQKNDFKKQRFSDKTAALQYLERATRVISETHEKIKPFEKEFENFLEISRQLFVEFNIDLDKKTESHSQYLACDRLTQLNRSLQILQKEISSTSIHDDRYDRLKQRVKEIHNAYRRIHKLNKILNKLQRRLGKLEKLAEGLRSELQVQTTSTTTKDEKEHPVLTIATTQPISSDEKDKDLKDEKLDPRSKGADAGRILTSTENDQKGLESESVHKEDEKEKSDDSEHSVASFSIRMPATKSSQQVSATAQSMSLGGDSDDKDKDKDKEDKHEHKDQKKAKQKEKPCPPLEFVEKLIGVHHSALFFIYHLNRYNDYFTQKQKTKEITLGDKIVQRYFSDIDHNGTVMNDSALNNKVAYLKWIITTLRNFPKLEDLHKYIDDLFKLKLSDYDQNTQDKITKAQKFCAVMFFTEDKIDDKKINQFVQGQYETVQKAKKYFYHVTYKAKKRELIGDLKGKLIRDQKGKDIVNKGRADAGLKARELASQFGDVIDGDPKKLKKHKVEKVEISQDPYLESLQREIAAQPKAREHEDYKEHKDAQRIIETEAAKIHNDEYINAVGLASNIADHLDTDAKLLKLFSELNQLISEVDIQNETLDESRFSSIVNEIELLLEPFKEDYQRFINLALDVLDPRVLRMHIKEEEISRINLYQKRILSQSLVKSNQELFKSDTQIESKHKSDPGTAHSHTDKKQEANKKGKTHGEMVPQIVKTFEKLKPLYKAFKAFDKLKQDKRYKPVLITDEIRPLLKEESKLIDEMSLRLQLGDLDTENTPSNPLFHSFSQIERALNDTSIDDPNFDEIIRQAESLLAPYSDENDIYVKFFQLAAKIDKIRALDKKISGQGAKISQLSPMESKDGSIDAIASREDLKSIHRPPVDLSLDSEADESERASSYHNFTEQLKQLNEQLDACITDQNNRLTIKQRRQNYLALKQMYIVHRKLEKLENALKKFNELKRLKAAQNAKKAKIEAAKKAAATVKPPVSLRRESISDDRKDESSPRNRLQIARTTSELSEQKSHLKEVDTSDDEERQGLLDDDALYETENVYEPYGDELLTPDQYVIPPSNSWLIAGTLIFIVAIVLLALIAGPFASLLLPGVAAAISSFTSSSWGSVAITAAFAAPTAGTFIDNFKYFFSSRKNAWRCIRNNPGRTLGVVLAIAGIIVATVCTGGIAGIAAVVIAGVASASPTLGAAYDDYRKGTSPSVLRILGVTLLLIGIGFALAPLSPFIISLGLGNLAATAIAGCAVAGSTRALSSFSVPSAGSFKENVKYFFSSPKNAWQCIKNNRAKIFGYALAITGLGLAIAFTGGLALIGIAAAAGLAPTIGALIDKHRNHKKAQPLERLRAVSDSHASHGVASKHQATKERQADLTISHDEKSDRSRSISASGAVSHPVNKEHKYIVSDDVSSSKSPAHPTPMGSVVAESADSTPLIRREEGDFDIQVITARQRKDSVESEHKHTPTHRQMDQKDSVFDPSGKVNRIMIFGSQANADHIPTPPKPPQESKRHGPSGPSKASGSANTLRSAS